MAFAPVRIDESRPTTSPDPRLIAPDVDGALLLARELGRSGLEPGTGRTLELVETLATLAAADLGVARAVEPHLDALAILDQAGDADDNRFDSTWGVFAAEGGAPLRASRSDSTWTLSGTKPWCSLADRLDRALVSATDDDGERRLFSVDLRASGVRVETDAWHARGLVEIPSGPVHFAEVEALPVGDAGWYLSRPGFSWGGICVAACWYGGAVGVARHLFDAIASRSEPGDLLLMHLGRVDEAMSSAKRILAASAAAIDDGAATGAAGSLLAKRARATVVRAAELVIGTSGHALGPAPLATDEAHAKRIADLQLYIRQHHAEKDEASLGGAVLRGGVAPW